MNKNFWKNKKVFITGHTGFKGSWLCLLLSYLGAKITGYALNPPTNPSLFQDAKIKKFLTKHIIADIRDKDNLRISIQENQPEIIFHLAASPIVLDSLFNPYETFDINLMGTINLLECIRNSKSIKAAIIVTSDKCYKNYNEKKIFTEDDCLGGGDPYSASKACCEIAALSYIWSFFKNKKYPNIATARAGNVIGGGDWANYRLIPDCAKAFIFKKTLVIRNPFHIRPWQHVLDALYGYLLLAEKLLVIIHLLPPYNFC
jgi:CDP-glucose 4,6-dehydratase